MSPRRRMLPLVVAAGLVLSPLAALAASRTAPLAAARSTDDIRDIRGPMAIPDPWRWLWAGAALLAVTGVAAVAVTLVRRRPRRPQSADERALARLAAAEALAAAGQPRAYAEAASDAVRAYIEERFGLPATHATTDEFLQDLIAQAQFPLGEHRWPLSQFLSMCDLAKFARLELPRASMEALSELARHFVVTTARPIVPQPASPTRTS